MRLGSIAPTVLALSLASGAAAASIPLRPGDYGAIGLACDNQPNATTMSFDGRSFSYAHASKCTDTVTRRSAGTLRIAETCRAAGDGSPAKANTATFGLRRQSATRFVLIKGESATSFRRCGPPGYFNRH
jgi:hypothetical protein